MDMFYTTNCPGTQDWKHEFSKTDNVNTFMNNSITGWVKKDPYNSITINWSKSVSGTISYSATITDSIKVGAELMKLAIDQTKELSSSISYSYSVNEITAYTWIINSNEPGNYFCIAVNYKTREWNVKHYKQKFKWFGQGEYEYQSTSRVEIPTDKYLAKNYRYEIDGVIYER